MTAAGHTGSFLRIALAVAAFGFLPACGRLVREERSECPAYLHFEIANPERFGLEEVIHISAFSYPDRAHIYSDSPGFGGVTSPKYLFEVMASETVFGYGVTGISGCRPSGSSGWVCDEGRDYDPLWRFDFSTYTGTGGEIVTVPVEFRKEHCRVTVRFLHSNLYPETAESFPFRIVIRSDTNGIDCASGEPARGPFRYEPPESPPGCFSFVVPRQYDRSLSLDIFGTKDTSGEALTSFNLWNLLLGCEGFSWEARNLPDVEMEICYAETGLVLSVESWAADGSYNYEY